MHQFLAGSQENHKRLSGSLHLARRSRRHGRSPGHRTSRPRLLLEALRLGYGLALAASPATVARWSGSGTDPRSQTIRQVLGLRHIAQAVLLVGAPRALHVLGGVVDLSHAASADWYAARTPSQRGDALVNAAVTTVLAAAECA